MTSWSVKKLKKLSIARNPQFTKHFVGCSKYAYSKIKNKNGFIAVIAKKKN